MRCLTAEQKQKCLGIATLLKERFGVYDQAFMCRIFATDETWIRDFEPELKITVQRVKATVSPWPKKLRRAQSKVKQMMNFAYDHQGVIMTGPKWNKNHWSVLLCFHANISQESAQEPTSVARGWATHSP